jgi:CheY-like chemotaxis protein
MPFNTHSTQHDIEDNVITNQYQLRVLVVEDNQDLAKLFCDLLEVMGCATDMAFNARAGLESARRTMPDLLFCDLRLPGEKDGFDLAAELRADPQLTHIPLIAVTGYDDADEHQRALQVGFERVFEKPVKFAQILEVLNNYRKQ